MIPQTLGGTTNLLQEVHKLPISIANGMSQSMVLFLFDVYTVRMLATHIYLNVVLNS